MALAFRTLTRHSSRMAGLFLGCELAPAGLSIGFLRADFSEVAQAFTSWRQGLGQVLEVANASVSSTIADIEPFQAPWTREVLFDCGPWTAYLNNGIDGGDPTASAPHVANLLGVDLFVALHAPRHDPGHASTQLWVIGPSGTPPLMYRRSICADCVDGQWSWRENGAPLPFERVERYSARRIRDRLDRPMLIDYLEANEIHADDPGFYGHGVTFTQKVHYPVRTESAAEVRRRFGW